MCCLRSFAPFLNLKPSIRCGRTNIKKCVRSLVKMFSYPVVLYTHTRLIKHLRTQSILSNVILPERIDDLQFNEPILTAYSSALRKKIRIIWPYPSHVHRTVNRSIAKICSRADPFSCLVHVYSTVFYMLKIRLFMLSITLDSISESGSTRN